MSSIGNVLIHTNLVYYTRKIKINPPSVFVNLSLNNNEAYLYSYEGYNDHTISLENIPYTIKGQIKNRQLQANNCFAPNNISIVINQSALNN